jgi:hypothetical protein
MMESRFAMAWILSNAWKLCKHYPAGRAGISSTGVATLWTASRAASRAQKWSGVTVARLDHHHDPTAKKRKTDRSLSEPASPTA